MTTFWTVLIITYGGFLDGEVSYIATPSQEACEAAMNLHHAMLSPEMPDVVLQCVQSERPTKLVRPKPRPEGLK